MKVTKTLSLGALTGLLLFSCQKEVDQFLPFESASKFNISEDFGSSSDTLLYEITLDEEKIIETPSNTQIILEKDLFSYASGENCNCEKIKIQVIELNKKRDHIIHKAYTVTENKLYESIRDLHISASSDQRPLAIKNDKKITIRSPGKDENEIIILHGDETLEATTWQTDSKVEIRITEWKTLSQTKVLSGYEYSIEKLGWNSLGSVVSSDRNISACLLLDTNVFNPDNTSAFIVFDDRKVVLEIPWQQNKLCTFLPSNKNLTILSISKSGPDQYELAQKKISPKEDLEIELSFEKKSFEQIQSFLNSL